MQHYYDTAKLAALYDEGYKLAEKFIADKQL
jgi:hypothetical protein